MISNHRESSLRVDRSLEAEMIVAAWLLPPVALLSDRPQKKIAPDYCANISSY
jgi:hypothetical protein